MTHHDYLQETVELLCQLIAIPSHSRDEKAAADHLQQAMESYGMKPARTANNLILADPYHNDSRPTVMLNAHIDTVKPSASWQHSPYEATTTDGRIYGLGSNDCGGGLITLLQTYRMLVNEPRHYNLIYVASAEEEVSGTNGIAAVLPLLPRIDLAIVGEPTGMQPAIAEKGLMVVDLLATGKSGHAARNEGVNAIYEALDDMAWLRSYHFERVSDLLGPVKMSLTVVQAGTQHNVVPDKCMMTVDVRTNECYTNEEVFDIIRRNVRSRATARSFRLHSSGIDPSHPLVRQCVAMGMTPYGSPTLSDQALMPFASLKLGPGESARSHTADEYICIDELRHALEVYPQLLQDTDWKQVSL